VPFHIQSGCALAWNQHWSLFVSQSSSASTSTSSSSSSSSLENSCDLSHAINTPWAVRYAHASIIEVDVITLAVIVIMILKMMMFLITTMLLLIMIFIYMQICTWIDSRSHESSSASWASSSTTSAAWTRACDPKSFVKFVCEQASGDYCDASYFDDSCVAYDGVWQRSAVHVIS